MAKIEEQKQGKEEVEKKIELAFEYKPVNLKYEYKDYEGTEKWAIITDLSENELLEKYGEIIERCYSPYLLLSKNLGEAIITYQNNEAKERMRRLRFGNMFDIDDEFEEHHPELAIEIDFEEQIELNDRITVLHFALSQLKETQKRRIIKHFFYQESYVQIAREEGVSHVAIMESIDTAIKKLKKFF